MIGASNEDDEQRGQGSNAPLEDEDDMSSGVSFAGDLDIPSKEDSRPRQRRSPSPSFPDPDKTGTDAMEDHEKWMLITVNSIA